MNASDWIAQAEQRREDALAARSGAVRYAAGLCAVSTAGGAGAKHGHPWCVFCEQRTEDECDRDRGQRGAHHIRACNTAQQRLRRKGGRRHGEGQA